MLRGERFLEIKAKLGQNCTDSKHGRACFMRSFLAVDAKNKTFVVMCIYRG